MKKRVFALILCLALMWLTAASAAAATYYSDGVFTFEKTENNAANIVECSSTESNVTVPDFVLGYPVVSIGDYAFLSNGFIESVKLPASVSSIGSYAFAQCGALERVDIPRWCDSIAENAFFNSPNVTFGCYYGTAAHTFAEEHFIPCVFLNSVTLGDTNGDKIVSIGDVTAIQRHIAGLGSLDGIFLLAADVNQDGEADITDATALQEYIAKYEVPYPIDEPIGIDYSETQN